MPRGAMPVWDSAGTTMTTSAAPGTFSVNVPTHTSGDLLILHVAPCNGDNDSTLSSIDTAGWTQLGGAGNTYLSGNRASVAGGWKIGNGSETTVSITIGGGKASDANSARVSRITAADGFDATPVQFIGSPVADSGSVQPVASPTVTPGGVKCLAISLYTKGFSAGGVWPAPTGETGGDWLQAYFITQSNNAGVLCYSLQTNGDTISGGSATTGSGSGSVAIGFGIVPAEVGGGASGSFIRPRERSFQHMIIR